MICANCKQLKETNQILEVAMYLVKRIIAIKNKTHYAHISDDPKIRKLLGYIEILIDVKHQLKPILDKA